MVIEKNNEWLTTNYIDCNPEVEERYLRVIFRPLLAFAPKDSTFRFKVRLRGTILKGTLEIQSSRKSFVSTVYAHQIYDLAEKAKKDMCWQIEAWKNAHHMNIAI